MPTLAGFAGKRCSGQWTLRIKDAARLDSGRLVKFLLRLSLPHAERTVVVPASTGRLGRKKAVAKEGRRSARPLSV